MNYLPVVAMLFVVLTLCHTVRAQSLVNIETVTVGDAGNAARVSRYCSGRGGSC
jgi:hypothetical protein